MVARCPVQLHNGQYCNAPAAILDAQRSTLVCIIHAPRCTICRGKLLEAAPNGVHDGCAIDAGITGGGSDLCVAKAATATAREGQRTGCGDRTAGCQVR